MFIHQTIDRLNAMKLTAMAKAFTEQLQRPDIASLSFEERFSLIVDFQMLDVENRRLQNRLKTAKLRLSASIEDLDFKEGRGLDRSQVMSLTMNHWVRNNQNILITGPTGAGKSYLACALAQKACRDGHTVLYQWLPNLLDSLAMARNDGRYQKIMAPLAKCEVLVLDDLLISPITLDAQRELLRIVEDRYGRKSTIITSQLPIKAWHNAMQDPTVADAIMDRIVHNSHKLELKGDSMRKKRASLTKQ